MASFTSKWQKIQDNPKIGSRIKEGLKSAEPIRPKLEQAARQIQGQIIRLEQAVAKLKEKDQLVFSQIVSSVQRNDNARANMLANELMEIRKMKNMAVQARLALEQLTLRLSTVTELGDIAVTLTPALNTIKSVRPGLATLVPDAEREIGEISSLLSGIMVDAGQITTSQLTFETANEEAEHVLAQAAAIAMQQEKSKFPDTPDTDYVEQEPETE